MGDVTRGIKAVERAQKRRRLSHHPSSSNCVGARGPLLDPRFTTHPEHAAGTTSGMDMAQQAAGSEDAVEASGVRDVEGDEALGGPGQEDGIQRDADADPTAEQAEGIAAGHLPDGAGAMDELPFRLPAPLTGFDAQEAVLSNKDLVLRIFKFLEFPQVANSAFVSRAWRAVAESKEFWSHVNMEGRPVKIDQLFAIVERHPHIVTLNIIGVSLNAAPGIVSVLLWARLSQLTELYIGGGQLEQAELLLGPSLPSLRKWVIRNGMFGIGPSNVAEVQINHANVIHLELDNCKAGRVHVQCPRVQRLSLVNLTASALQVTTPSITHLELINCSKMTEAGLRMGVTRLVSLIDLDLSGNSSLTDDTLREISQACVQVTRLVARSCVGLTMSGVRGFPELRSLDLGGCDSLVPTALMPTLEAWSTLEEINLESCSLVTQLQLTLGRLRLLQVQGCRSLAWLELQCPNLVELRLSADGQKPAGCGILKRITLHSNSMQQISWRGFPSLEMVTLGCPVLRRCDLSECDGLVNATLDTFASGPGGTKCPRLEELRLDNCDGLTEVRLRSNSLTRLSLSSCKRLEAVHLETKFLRNLCLDECDEITRVTLAPADVDKLCLGSCPHLEALKLDCPRLQSLDVSGCGCLHVLTLQCPAMHTLMGAFCNKLSDDTLAEAVKGATGICALTLSVCLSLGNKGVAALGSLRNLQQLDLSYTSVEALDPVYGACPSLHKLTLASCNKLQPNALDAILPAPGGAGHIDAYKLPALKFLDISYCHFPTEKLANVLRYGTRLQELLMMGCTEATDAVLKPLNNSDAPQSALSSLSLIACKKLRACWLGMEPASADEESAQERLLAMGPHADAPVIDHERSWRRHPTVLSGLETLRLNLAGVRSIALCLPRLTRLECNSCAELRSLELRCPVLTFAAFQHSPITRPMLEAFLPGVEPPLKLDLQYNWGLGEVVEELRQQYDEDDVDIMFQNYPASYYSDIEDSFGDSDE